MTLLIRTQQTPRLAHILLPKPQIRPLDSGIQVYILPRGGRGIGEFVGRDADDGAVLRVEGVEDVVETAALEGEDPGEAGGPVEEGAWVGGEGVEGEVVEEEAEGGLEMLGWASISGMDIDRTHKDECGGDDGEGLGESWKWEDL